MVAVAQIAIAIDARRAEEGAQQAKRAMDQVSVGAKSAGESVNRLDGYLDQIGSHGTSGLSRVSSQARVARSEFGELGEIALSTAEKAGKGFEHIFSRFQTHFAADFVVQAVGMGTAWGLASKAADALAESIPHIWEAITAGEEPMRRQNELITEQVKRLEELRKKEEERSTVRGLGFGVGAVTIDPSIKDDDLRAQAERDVLNAQKRLQELADQKGSGVQDATKLLEIEQESFDVRARLLEQLDSLRVAEKVRQEQLRILADNEKSAADREKERIKAENDANALPGQFNKDLAAIDAKKQALLEIANINQREMQYDQGRIRMEEDLAAWAKKQADEKERAAKFDKTAGLPHQFEIGNPFAGLSATLVPLALQSNNIVALEKVIEKLKEEDEAIGQTSSARRADQILRANDVHLIGAQSDAIDALKDKIEQLQTKIENDAQRHQLAHMLADDMTNGILAVQQGTATVRDLFENMLLDIERMFLQRNLTKPLEDWLYSSLGGFFGGGSGGGLGSGGSTFGQDSTTGNVPPPLGDSSGGNSPFASQGGGGGPGSGARTVTVVQHINIHTPDVNGFNLSKRQVAEDARRFAGI